MHDTTSDGAPATWTPWDDDVATDEPRRRPPWLLLAGVVPWVVAGAFLWWPRPAGPPPAEPTAAPVPTAAATPVGSEDAAAVPARTIASGARTAVAESEAHAVATLLARAWLTDVGPQLDVGIGNAGRGLYAEHLVVEGVDHPAPGAAVVTLLAVVLRPAGDVYDSARTLRVAVPLRFDAGGAAPAGTPYLLPVEPPAARPLDAGAEITDTEQLLAAGEALAAAGYADVEVRSLARTSAWPLVVTALARGPGDEAPAEHVLWLREHLGRLVVAGTRPAPAPTPETRP